MSSAAVVSFAVGGGCGRAGIVSVHRCPRSRRPVLQRLTGVLLLSGVILAGCAETESADAPDTDPYHIVFVPAVEDPFYRAIGEGAARAAEQARVRLSVSEYPNAWDAELQRRLIESIDFSDVDALLVGPTSTVALLDTLATVARRGTAIVTVDTYVGDGDYTAGPDRFAVSYVGTDNFDGGKRIAEALAELVGKEGEVYVSTTHSDVSSVSDRVEGFRAGMGEFPNMSVVATDFNQDRESVAHQQTLERLREHPHIRAVFATNLFSSQGAYRAVLDTGLNGAVRIASWDSTEPVMNALHSGFVDLVLAQRPTEIGRRALRLAVDHLNGRSVPGTVHVGVDLITSESLDDIDPAEVTY